MKANEINDYCDAHTQNRRPNMIWSQINVHSQTLQSGHYNTTGNVFTVKAIQRCSWYQRDELFLIILISFRCIHRRVPGYSAAQPTLCQSAQRNLLPVCQPWAVLEKSPWRLLEYGWRDALSEGWENHAIYPLGAEFATAALVQAGCLAGSQLQQREVALDHR